MMLTHALSFLVLRSFVCLFFWHAGRIERDEDKGGQRASPSATQVRPLSTTCTPSSATNSTKYYHHHCHNHYHNYTTVNNNNNYNNNNNNNSTQSLQQRETEKRLSATDTHNRLLLSVNRANHVYLQFIYYDLLTHVTYLEVIVKPSAETSRQNRRSK